MTVQPFLEQLIERHVLTRDDSVRLLDKYKGDTFEILLHLLRGKVVPKAELGRMWSDALNLSYVDLEKTLFQSEAVKKLPEDQARSQVVIPLYELQGCLTVAMSAPADRHLLHRLEEVAGRPVSPVFSFPDEIRDAIEIQYQSDSELQRFVERVSNNSLLKGTAKITGDQLRELAGDQAVVEFVRGLLLLGVRERASDIHVDPHEDVVFIRYRIDGVLQDRLKLEKTLHAPVISRFKIMASLDITERRRPQDGRISLTLSQKSIDFRLATVPTIHGEKLVLRFLGQLRKDDIPKLTELGLLAGNLQKMQRIIGTPNGAFFVTGPTGSGKSTTLFSVLQELNKPGVNIMTVEDPVEYRLPRINQVQVNRAIDFDFAMALRSFLRLDPDIILIGEIRDLETAKIASQAALTGHLVLATMHTNGAVQAVTRLVEIGVEPFLIAPSIIGVMGQRLVRRICPHCKEAYRPVASDIERHFNWDGATEVLFYRGRGCEECNQQGYSGRIGIHELFILSEDVRSMIARQVSILDIKTVALQHGFQPMRYDGLKKVLMGLTTLAELDRVTAEDE